MIEYRWKGIDQDGLTKKGVSFALSPENLQQQLYQNGIALLEYHEPLCKRFRSISFLKTTAISTPEKALFFQHIGTLLEHGIPLIKALASAAHQANSIPLKTLIFEILADVEKGKSFSVTLHAHFPQEALSFHGLLENAEKTGALGFVCKQIGKYMESLQLMKQNVKRALTTPALTFLFALTVTLLILLFVVPHFEELFRSSKATVPPLTKSLFRVSSWMKSFWGFASMMSFFIVSLFFIKLQPLRMLVKKRVLSLFPYLPIVNHIFFDYIALSFLQTLHLYVHAGLPLVLGLDQAQANIPLLASVSSLEKTIATRVREGISLERALEEFKITFCSATTIAFIGIGEQTGNLGEMLGKAVFMQENQLLKRLESMSSLVGPVVTIVLGIFIAGLLITIYLPIFSLAQFSGI